METDAALPGTQALPAGAASGEAMVAGLATWCEREIRRTVLGWTEFHGTEALRERRAEARRRIGVEDVRLPPSGLELRASTAAPARVAAAPGYEILAVRWPVLPGVDGEGLLLRPKGAVRASVVAIGDAGWSPEALAGVAPGLPASAQFARRLAERGCQVVVPVVIDRGTDGTGGLGRREYVWRMAFEFGRHIIGYEVQRVLALVDQFAAEPAPVGVFGFGEGGLLALWAAAVDERIAATVCSGHFRSREAVWREPIDRDVWGLLRAGLDDGGLAQLIPPRGLVLEMATLPGGPRPGGPPPAEASWEEAGRAARAFAALGCRGLVVTDPGEGERTHPGMPETLEAFLRLAEGRRGSEAVAARESAFPPDGPPPEIVGPLPDAGARRDRQFRQLVEHVQGLRRRSEGVRAAWWADVPRTGPGDWDRGCAARRAAVAAEVIGTCPAPDGPPAARSRAVPGPEGCRMYEVALQVWPDVFAAGLLLLPGDLRPGERRPAVVCQHGLEGRSADTVEGPENSPYRRFAARLAAFGFIVYAPQNPYLGGETFRRVQRMAHPLGLSLFSFIVAQHARTLEWLSSQPWIDPARIGLYGISYGGKTAMRVPALLPGYALSICSADFNEWVYKCTAEDPRCSYLYTGEYDMYEWNLAHRCNYAELAGLIAPRPFMVERGHRDPVGLDEFVAFEYAKVRRLYADLGIPERTEIAFFEGGHAVDGAGTFPFLLRHLGNPRDAP